MQSKEEIEEAIERIKYLLTDGCDCESCKKDKRAYRIVLKELERLQEENKQHKRIKDIADSVTQEEVEETIKRVEKEFISKDKIREKIIIDKSKLNNCTNDIFKKICKARIEFGQELLEGK